MATKKAVPTENQEEVHVDLSELKEDESFNPEQELVAPGDRTLSAVGYFSVLCLLPLLLRPDNAYCKFHGKQGLAMLICYIPFSIFARIIDVFAGIPVGMGLITFLFFLIQLYGAWKAWNGIKLEIPPFSHVVDKYLQWEKKVAEEIEIPTDSE